MNTLNPEDVVWVTGAGVPAPQPIEAERSEAQALEPAPPGRGPRDVETPRSKRYP